MEGSHARCRPGPQRRAAARPARAGVRRVRVPVPGRHRRRRARDPGPPLRLGGPGVVGAAADATAPYVEGRARALPSLRVARRRGLADARGRRLGRARDRGRCTRPRRIRARDDRRRAAGVAGGARASTAAGRWLPFSPGSPTSCWTMSGARLGPARRRAARSGCRSARSRRRRRRAGRESPASRASRSTSTGTPRRSPPSSSCRRARARPHASGRPLPARAARALPAHYGVELAPNARGVLDPLRREHDAAIDGVRRSRAHDAAPLDIEDRLGGELARSSAPACATRSTRGARSSPTSRVSARPCRRSPRSSPTTRTRPSSSARPR